jgi:antitoxin component of RelBE/YafQ-DinJ toxin-antitoxin module
MMIDCDPIQRQNYLNSLHKNKMKIPQEHKDELNAIAANLGISLDEVVEQAIAQFLESRPLPEKMRTSDAESFIDAIDVSRVVSLDESTYRQLQQYLSASGESIDAFLFKAIRLLLAVAKGSFVEIGHRGDQRAIAFSLSSVDYEQFQKNCDRLGMSLSDGAIMAIGLLGR